MIERLRKPGGTIGSLSVLSAGMLALVGAVGLVAMLVSIATGSDFWSDSNGDKTVAAAFFVLIYLGAVGFFVQDRYPWPGGALGALGGVAFAFLMFWAIAPILLGLGAAAVAMVRARDLAHGTGHAAAA